MDLKKLVDLMYHPKLVDLSYRIYEISAGLGFAIMPKDYEPKVPEKDYLQKI